MNQQRLAILIASGLGALATFMPWVKAPFIGSIAGTQGDGWITFILFNISLILSLRGDKTKSIAGGKRFATVIPPIIAAFIGITKILSFNSNMGDLGDNSLAQAMGASISIEFGLYLVILAGIGVPIFAFLIKDRYPDERYDF